MVNEGTRASVEILIGELARPGHGERIAIVHAVDLGTNWHQTVSQEHKSWRDPAKGGTPGVSRES